jgi:flagellar hook-associated protein 3 FlgL
MSINTISTYAIFQSTIGDVSNVETNLSNLQNELSSGQKSQNFQGLGAQATQYLDLQSKLAASNQYTTNNNLISNTLDVTNTSLTQIITSANSLASLISTNLNTATSNGTNFGLQLNSQWQALTAALNVTSNGQFVFSGTKTNTQAVNTTTFPTVDADGGANQDYYQGSSQDLSAQVQDGVSMTYNVRANDPAFQKLFAGLALANKSANDTDPGQKATDLNSAYNMVQSGIKGVITLQATVNANKVALSNTNTNLQSLQTYWTGLQQSIGNTDLVTVSTQVAVDQGILQAAFQAFAKINQLNLASFL